jgi:autotransporter-associated beta strand protein
MFLRTTKKRLLILLALGCAGIATAVTTVSTNATSGSWNDSSRWSAGVPTQTDDAVLAASTNNVTTTISNYPAEARSLVLSNANQNSAVKILNGGSLTLYGDTQVAGSGSIRPGDGSPSGSITVSQTNAAAAGSVLNAASVSCQSLTITADAGTAVFTINSNQSFTAINCVVGNGGAGAGGLLTLAGGWLSLVQNLTLGNDNTDSGTFVFNGGELITRFGIRGGVSTNSAASLFVFNDGRISSTNYPVIYRGFSASPLVIQLAGTGLHEFNTVAGASVTVEATARLTDKPGEHGTLLKTGGAILTLKGTNSYSGGTVISNGTLEVNADGGAGTGDIWVGNATLSLSGGVANDYLNDSAQLVLQGASSALYLGFTGTDTVSAVSLDGGASWLATGVYDAAALNVIGAGFYSGAGHLNVTTTPGPVTVPPADTGIWDMTSLRTNPVVMQTVSSLTSDGYIHDEVHFFITNSAGTVDRFYACVSQPSVTNGPLPLIFLLHGGGGHASRAFAKVPISNLPAGQQAFCVALDYGTSHTDAQIPLHTLYGAPVPQGFSASVDINEESLYRDMMGFRRILDYLLAQGTIDTNKVAVFGTSWGGFRTMLWAGLDSRIKVAATSPGAGGMRNSTSQIGRQAAAMPEPMRERWYRQFDPLSHAGQVTARVFLEAPANDWWFWLGGVQDNLKAVPADKRWLIVPNNNHGLGAPDTATGGVTMPFIMNTFFGGPIWPEVTEDSLNSLGLTYEWQLTNGTATSSTLYFSPGETAAGTKWPSRYWTKIPATFSDGKWSATLPNQFFEVAGEVFVSVTDTNGFKASSFIQSRGGRNPLTSRCTLWNTDHIWDIAAQENSWRPVDSINAVIEKGSAAGSVKLTPVTNGQLSVCNNSVIMAAPYAATRQGLKLTLNGNGTAGKVQIELLKNSQVPGGEFFAATNVSVGTGDTEVILPWSAFVPQGTATGNPYPFDGLGLRVTRTGNVPLTVQSLDFYEPKTTTGVPHWWLLEQGFSGDMEAAAQADDDEDGLKTWQEYAAGTDPFDPASALRISMTLKPAQKALLSWTPVHLGRNYTVESTEDLKTGFAAATPQLDYPVSAYTTTTTAAQNFYKVTVDYTGSVRSASSYLPYGVAVLNPDGTSNRMVRYNTAGQLTDVRAFGVNWHTAFSRYLENVNDRSFTNGFAYLAAHRIPVARMEIQRYGPIGWSLYFSDKAEYFRRLDDFVEQAELHGIGLHINILGGIDPVGELVDDAVDASYLIPGIDFTPPSPLNLDLYGVPTYAEYRTDLAREDSGSNAFIDYFTREIVRRYKNSPAIWCWEFANEANNAVDLPNIQDYRPEPNPALGYFLQRDGTNVAAWASKDDVTREHVRVAKILFARAVRAEDSWRMICSGDSRPRQNAYHNWKYQSWTVDTKAEIVQVLPMDSPSPINTQCFHIYQPTDPYFSDDPVSLAPVTGDYAAFLAFFKDASAQLGRPMIVGEWGANGDGTTQDEITTFTRFLQALIDTGIQYSLLWSFDNTTGNQADSFWVNPGTPKEYQLLDLEQANRQYGTW